MCFSAEVSFAVGGALVPVGGYCATAALRKRPSLLGLALMPLFFGVQQISEGFVWQGLHHPDPHLTQIASLAFLFFALAFWPFWFPLFAMLMEPKAARKWLLAGVCVLATAWFWMLWLPLLLDPETLLKTEVVNHSISYEFSNLPVFQLPYTSKPFMRILYFLTLASPFVFTTERAGRLPGVMLAASALICVLIYSYAFVSVWCFFAAIMSAYIAWVMHRVPGKESSN
jgi:hypothetical protein